VSTAVQTQPQDLRDIIFSNISGRQYSATLTVERDGVIAGGQRLQAALANLRVNAEMLYSDGAEVRAGNAVARIIGNPKQIAVAEEFAVGTLAKPSGIATAARRAVQLAGSEMRIVCGAWKKMPPEIKSIVREAVVAGGAAFRIVDRPFLYLDKNFVRLLGGIRATLKAVEQIDDMLKVIQLKGQFGPMAQEALTAVESGADILMIDTGSLQDFESAQQALEAAGWRQRVKLAFANGVRLQDIPNLKGRGIDLLDIGTEIIDAPLLDMKLDVRGPA